MGDHFIQFHESFVKHISNLTLQAKIYEQDLINEDQDIILKFMKSI